VMSESKTDQPMTNGETPPQRSARWRVPALCVVLAAITFAVFGQTLDVGHLAGLDERLDDLPVRGIPAD